MARTKKVISLSIDEELLKEIDNNRKFWNLTRSKEINNIIKEYFKKEL